MKKRHIAILMMVLLLSGCGKDAENISNEAGKTYIEAEEGEQGKSKQKNDNLTEQEKMEQNPMDRADTQGSINEVVISAHIKEISEKTMVISSDSDGYPGAFRVEVTERAGDVSEFEGGDSIVIHMTDLNSEQDGMKAFQAYQIILQDELDKETGHLDVLLTAPPVVSLSDVLSSTMNQLEVQSDSYEWSYEEEGEIIGTVACGAAPIDEAQLNLRQVLTVPDYSETENVIYSMNAVILPDEVVLRKWSMNEPGNTEAKPERIINYFCQPFFLELEKNAIYEITAKWSERYLDMNSFYGNASYIFTTK